MAFYFSLQTLLRFRQSLERREEILLQKGNQEVARLRTKIEILDQFVAGQQSLRHAELVRGIFASELQFGRLTDASFETLRRTLCQELGRAEAVRDQQRAAFRKARSDREAVEAIRDRQLQLYKERQERRTQRDFDDLILMRREFLRRG